jgi:hypothetical protein
MQAMAAQALALVRVAEGWSVANVLGALLLGTFVLVAVVAAISVTLRQ